MTFKIIWTVDVDEELWTQQSYRRFLDRLYDALRGEVELAVDVAITLAPMDTGYLKSRIGIIEENREGLYIVAGTQDVPYAIYVEFGTSKMEARSFWRPAIWQAWYRFMDRARQITEGWVKNGGR
jgi:HK97 gp10 family phage protein